MAVEKRILITGATGFLGGALARRLSAGGVNVVALARSSSKVEGLTQVGIPVVRGDMTNRGSLREAVLDCEVVIHCAASFGHPDEQRDVNINGTRALAEECGFAGVKRMVYISSIAVYGFARRGIVTEEDKPVPGAYAYARTKYGGELALRDVALHTGMQRVIVRPGMIYGPGSPNWTAGLFRYVKRNPIVFPGSGSGSAHPIFLDDVIDMLVRVHDDDALNGEVFNCSPDPAPTWREWLLGYASLAGHHNWLPIPPFLAKTGAGIAMGFAPPASLLRDLPDMVDQFLSSVTYSTAKARSMLGWTQKVSLQEGIARCEPYLREKGLL